MKPYYEDENIRIYHGDALKIMPEIEPGDACVTDPPYNQTSLDWDVWPNGWLRLVRANSLWCFGSMRMFMSKVNEFMEAGFLMSQDIVWEKHNGSSFHADRFRRVHESAVHCYRGPWGFIYHQTPTTPDATKRQVRRKQRPPHMGNIDAGSYESVDGGPRLMTSVMYAKSCHGYAQNETQKPLDIIKPLIEYACKPSGVILDPFCGSGSALIAARDLGRLSIGIEIRESQCEIAAQRASQRLLALQDVQPIRVSKYGLCE